MSRVGKEPIAIAYMPWANLKEEFSVGPVSFWPFYEKADERVPDAKVRSDLTRFFETFVDYVGKPVRTVVACSCGDVSFRRFSDEERGAISAAVDCLAFAAITTGVKGAVCANNCSMAPPSADRFDLCARWIWPIQDGVVIRTENSTNIWSDGKYKITRPVSLGGSLASTYGSLLQGLSGVFAPPFPNEVRERLFRSLEWFRFAHTESTSVSWLHKVVMMATAYEILLHFPESGKRRYFIGEVNTKLRLSNSYMGTLRDGQRGTFPVCKAAEWAGQFYKLRNDITHGDTVSSDSLRYKDWVTHLIVADLVMLEWVKRLLYEHGCVGDRLRKNVARFAPCVSGEVEVLEATLLPSFHGLDFECVHEALGWIPPMSDRRERKKS